MSTTVPYESASSGASARDEVTKILRRFGCESVGFMPDNGFGQFLRSILIRRFRLDRPCLRSLHARVPPLERRDAGGFPLLAFREIRHRLVCRRALLRPLVQAPQNLRRNIRILRLTSCDDGGLARERAGYPET